MWIEDGWLAIKKKAAETQEINSAQSAPNHTFNSEKANEELKKLDDSQKESLLSARQQVLLTILRKGPAYKRTGDGNKYNHYLQLCKTSDRTGYANESWKKAKKLIADYEAILDFLTPNQKQQAVTEINIIRAKR